MSGLLKELFGKVELAGPENHPKLFGFEVIGRTQEDAKFPEGFEGLGNPKNVNDVFSNYLSSWDFGLEAPLVGVDFGGIGGIEVIGRAGDKYVLSTLFGQSFIFLVDKPLIDGQFNFDPSRFNWDSNPKIRTLIPSDVDYPADFEPIGDPNSWNYVFDNHVIGELGSDLDQLLGANVIGRASDKYALLGFGGNVFLADRGLVESLGFNPNHFNWGQK